MRALNVQNEADKRLNVLLLLRCIDEQLLKVQSASLSKHSQFDPQSPSHGPYHGQLSLSHHFREQEALHLIFAVKDKLRFICDMREMHMISSRIKAGLDQFLFQYKDDGRIEDDGDHLIRAKLTCCAFFEFSDKYRSGSTSAKANAQNEPGSAWKCNHWKLEPLQGSLRMNDVLTVSFLHHFEGQDQLADAHCGRGRAIAITRTRSK